MRALAVAISLLAAACQGAPAAVEGAVEGAVEDTVDDVVDGAPESTPAPPRAWTAEFAFPVGIGYSELRLGEGVPLDRLTTLTFVPTLELHHRLADEWTLMPFIGLGGGWLVSEDKGLGILTTGVSLEWKREFADECELRIVPRARYDANLNLPDGLLGDWGRNDLSIELRRAFGESGDALRLEPGIYGQLFWFWDDVEFDIPGVTPSSVDNQQEFGLSLGTRDALELFGVTVPRVFLGYRFGDGVRTLSIRFGEL